MKKEKKKLRSLGYRCSHSVLTWFFQGTSIVVVTGKYTLALPRIRTWKTRPWRPNSFGEMVPEAYVLDQKSFCS